MSLQSVCIFCGVSSAFEPAYSIVATELGELIGSKGIPLIYGGGSTGLMGVVADGVLKSEGEVTSALPPLSGPV